jgi:hypothetical protein
MASIILDDNLNARKCNWPYHHPLFNSIRLVGLTKLIGLVPMPEAQWASRPRSPEVVVCGVFQNSRSHHSRILLMDDSMMWRARSL